MKYAIKHYNHIKKQYVIVDDVRHDLSVYDLDFNEIFVDTKYNQSFVLKEHSKIVAPEFNFEKVDITPSNYNENFENFEKEMVKYFEKLKAITGFSTFYNAQFLSDNLAMFSNSAVESRVHFYNFEKREIIKSVELSVTAVPKDIKSLCYYSILYNSNKEKFYYTVGGYGTKEDRLFECDKNGEIIKELKPDTKIETVIICFEFEDKFYFLTNKSIVIIDENSLIETIALSTPFKKFPKGTIYFDYNKQTIVIEDKKTPIKILLDGHVDKFEMTKGRFDDIIKHLKEQEKLAKKPKKEDIDPKDFEAYIMANGLTKFVFENYTNEEILHGGYMWLQQSGEPEGKEEEILDSIGWLKTEIDCGGLEQYIENCDGDVEDVITHLKVVGANKTAKIIKKASTFYNEDDDIYFSKMEELENELEKEDFAKLTINYLKEKVLKQCR